MTKAQRKRRAEQTIERYKVNYSIPFWTAYREGNNKEIARWCTRAYDFKLGMQTAEPHARWYKRLNQVDIEVKKMICPEKDDTK